MLFTLFFVVMTYLLAAESFTHFLFPAPGEVTYHFRAGALPVGAVRSPGDGVCADHHSRLDADLCGEPRTKPFACRQWVDALQVRIYLLLMNRLYLDALSVRLQAIFTPVIERLERAAGSFPMLPALIAVVSARVCRRCASAGSDAKPAPSLIHRCSRAAALSLARNLYCRAHTRSGIFSSVALAVLPAGGRACTVWCTMPRICPAEILRAVSALALVGALYGSLKALGADEVPSLLAYASLAFYSLSGGTFGATGNLVSTGALSMSRRRLCSPPACCSPGSACAGATAI